ncbi:cytochrome P450 [Reichenbachiella ulvae]|uniref:Cytochrome P450 n=1 Tax=Reichenbachiella ulvae TaxID=2980104 RepID=A0ABT3CX47_9BACT|nr:cytochrome P450 [Reichenbachiella ulvae]MCV9388169.1 cytochrome P450 [Reichenbachiella ulvae]
MIDLPKAFPQNRSIKNLKKFQSNPLLYMKEAAKWGSPVDLNLPMGDFVLISDPEQAQFILATNHQNYKKSRGYKEVARVLGQGLLTAEGDFWHKQRKLLQPSFHKPELKKLLPTVWETTRSYIESYQQDEIRLDTEMNGLTLTVLLNSLIKYQDEELKSAMSRNIEFAQEFIVDRIRSPLKWPLWLPTPTHQRYHRMMKESNELIQKCVDSRKAIAEEDVNDILSVLMDHLDPKDEFGQIRDELLTFLVAGHETSALAMTWTLHLLAHYPEVQDKLYQEVKDMDQLEAMDMMNFSNLQYLHRVVMESMRFYPPIWNIVRQAKQPDEVGGVRIEVGKQLMINIYQLHHNSDYWSDPETFRPERFEEGELKHKFQYLPFGAGPRFCIGNNFAMFEIMILLTQFVKIFRFSPITPEKVEFNPLLTLRPKEEVRVVAERR